MSDVREEREKILSMDTIEDVQQYHANKVPDALRKKFDIEDQEQKDVYVENMLEELDENDDRQDVDWERFEVRKRLTAEEKEVEKMYQ